MREIRVTYEQDGEILNRSYSYWPQAFRSGDEVQVFAGHADGRPRFFKVNLSNDSVEHVGPLLGYGGTSEGWYWGADGWLYLCDGPRLRKVNPFTGQDDVAFDISDRFPGYRIWQAHSSDDGMKHSATVERIVSDGPYVRIGTVMAHPGGIEFYGALGALDESQISPDGRFLVIKEEDDNRILDLEYGTERRITDADGALGHSDLGPGYMVGENNQIGACEYIDLNTLKRRTLFRTWGMGVLSVRAGRCLLSGPQAISLVPLDGGDPVHQIDHGMEGSGYEFFVRANLSPDGSVAAYLSNKSGRMDLYLLVL